MIKIRTTYAMTTPESARYGDYSESGYMVGGVEVPLDEFEEDFEIEDAEIEFGTVEDAVEFLSREGAVEKSSSCNDPHNWYSGEWYTSDYSTGEEKQESYHIDATPAQAKEICCRLMPDRNCD